MPTLIKRLVIILLALLLLTLAAGYLFLSSTSFREFARNQAEEWFNGHFRGRLSLQGLQWRLLSNSVVVQGLQIDAPETTDSQPAIRVRRAVVNFSVGNLISPRFDLQEVQLEGLNVRVWREADGRLNLARAFERPGSPPRPPGQEADIRPMIDLAIDHIRARDSQLLYENEPIHLDTFEGTLGFRLDFLPLSRAYRGQLAMRNMRLGVAGRELPSLDLETQFDLQQTQVQFDNITFRSPWLNGRMSGLLEGYESLQHRFDLNLQMDVRTLAEAFSLETPLRGRVTLRGTARGRRGEYGMVGQVSGETLEVGPIEVVAPQAEFRLDQEGVDLSRFSGRFQEVPFEGSGQLQWQAEGESRVEVRATALGRHAVAQSLRSYALLSSSGQARGEIRFPGISFSQWQGSGTLEIPGRLAPRPGFDPAPTYQLQSHWQGDSSGLSFTDCGIQLEEAGVVCSGSFQSPDTFSFDFQYDTRSSAPVVAWAETWLPEVEHEVRGEITGQGTLRRDSGNLSWESRTRIERAALRGFDLGSLAAEVNTGEDELWLVKLEFPSPGPVQGTVSAELDHAQMPVRSAEVSLQGEVGSLLDETLGLEGSQAPAQIQASLSRNEDDTLSASLQLTGEAWKLAGQEIARLQGDAELQGQTLQIRNFQAQIPDQGVLEVSGEVDLETQAHRLEIEARQLELSRLSFLPQPLPVSGMVKLKGTSSGTRWPPQFSFEIEGEKLQFLDQQIGPFSTRISHPAGSAEAEMSGQLEFIDQPFSFRGAVGLDSPYPVKLSSQTVGLPPESLLDFFFPEEAGNLPPITGLIAGQVAVAADLSPAKLENIQAQLSQVQLRSSDFELRNRNPLRLKLQEQTLTLEEVAFEGAGASLTLRGNLRLLEDPQLNFRVNGTAPLALANPFLNGPSTQGQADVQLVLAGTWGNPRIVGEVNVANATLQHPSLPTRLTDIKSHFRFTANQIAVEEFSAQTSYGVFNAEGGVFLDGFTPSRWFLNISGQDLRIAYPENLVSVMDVDLDLSRGDGAPLLSGIVHVRSADYDRDISLTDLLFRYSQLTPTPGAGGDETELNLNLTVNAYRAIRIQNNLADVSASGDLRVRGTLANPVLLGSLTVDEGRLFFERNEYRIVRGGMNFNDPRRTRPVLNFEAETEVQDYTINILVNGRLDRLNVNFRSDPPLPTPNIVSLLALGQTGEDLFRGSADVRAGSLAVYGAGALLNQSLNERLQRQSNRLFGLDRISIDPFLSSVERDPGARVTLGKHLGNRLSVTYSTALGSEAQGQIVVIQWKLTDWLTVVGTGEQNGGLALDFKLRRRF